MSVSGLSHNIRSKRSIVISIHPRRFGVRPNVGRKVHNIVHSSMFLKLAARCFVAANDKRRLRVLRARRNRSVLPSNDTIALAIGTKQVGIFHQTARRALVERRKL